MLAWKSRILGLTLAGSLWGCSGSVLVAPVQAQQIASSKASRLAAEFSQVCEAAPGPRKKARNGEGDALKRSYETYLKKPETLGFAPNDGLFRNVYFHAQTAFVEEVKESQLTAGIVKELTNFLSQAKVDTKSLKSIEGMKPVEVYNKVQELYGNKVDASLLGYATLNGLLDGLKDHYSVLMTPDEWSKMDEQFNSKSFGGIGVYIEVDREAGNLLTIFEPIEGTPADKAGLLAGDRLIKIDGKPTQGVPIDVCTTWIRGKEGTNVILSVQRDEQMQEITVTRGRIQTQSVSSRMFPGDVGYVRLRSFASDTGNELDVALSKLKSQGAKSLIVDLRNNGGGYIDASVEVMGEFTDPNTLVVYTIDRNNRRREYRTRRQGQYRMPMVVMINELSASASEITAGCMRDHKVAQVVGDHSFGKGSVQQLYPLEYAGAKAPRLKLTIARFYTPAGSVIDRKGIEPEVLVDMEPRFVGKVEKDIQLKKALEILGGSIK